MAKTKPTSPNDSGFRSEPYTGAGAGWGSIKSSLAHVQRELGMARGIGLLAQVNQKKGFDCPGCAWPDPDKPSLVEFCENGVKAVAEEATIARMSPDAFAKWPISYLNEQTDFWLGQQGRLTHPMIRHPESDRYEPISWDDAFSLIAEHLNKLESPDEAIFYTSGRTSNEAAYLYQLFVRMYGTNNLPDCSNMCHESSGRGLGETIGIGKGTVLLEDFDKAEAIFVVGQNPGTNHPRMLTALQRAARNGCKIVSINPLREPGLMRFKHPQEVSGIIGTGTPLASLHLPVRINGDVALLKGIAKAILEAEDNAPGTVLDHDFINEYTEGFEAYLDGIKATSWDDIIDNSGLSRKQIQEAADIAINAKSLICCWAMGLTQHKNGVANIQEVVNLLLLQGNIGKPGAGACPVRGHSNVQGDRTMGIWERPTEAFLQRIADEFDFSPPTHHGYDVVDAIRAMHQGKARVFFALGGNFLSATPDTDYTIEALQRCDLTVQVSTKLNRSHLLTGNTALILPCLGRTERDTQNGHEQFVTVENSMGIVHPSRGHLEPASEWLLSEPQIIARLAEATIGQRTDVNWMQLGGDYSLIRDHIGNSIPGFEDLNARITKEERIILPNGPRERRFTTPSGKAHFTVHPLPDNPLQAGQYMMMTIRSHDQYNTTIYGLDDRYRGVYQERRIVMMNTEDIKAEGLFEGQYVDLTSHFDGEERQAPNFIVVPYELPRRSAATYFPEANVLVPIDSVAEKSNTPASKSIVITIKPASAPPTS
jgi:molybdopterin-dependent oxidoreductase alpha subunit